MEQANIAESDLLLLLEKQISTLNEVLELSQRQIAELETSGLNWLLDQKDLKLEELKKTETMLGQWSEIHKRELFPEENKKLMLIRELLEAIEQSELDFEKQLGQEKNSISTELGQLSRQMQYGKDASLQRANIKKMIT